jgi:hypothetical protein
MQEILFANTCHPVVYFYVLYVVRCATEVWVAFNAGSAQCAWYNVQGSETNPEEGTM